MSELAVLVPVLNRPQNVLPLVRSFLKNCPASATLHLVGDMVTDPDEYAAFTDATSSERVVWEQTTSAHTWPEKINVGYRRVVADWYLCAADDVRFHKDWWGQTATLRELPRIGVIGTNDLGNPRVMEGSHTCHPLVRREYAQQGTWDVPNSIACEAYQHWYVDNEIVITARMRNAWGMAIDAVVEHLHPYWKPGEVEWDETYALGEANSVNDLATWQARWLEFGGNV